MLNIRIAAMNLVITLLLCCTALYSQDKPTEPPPQGKPQVRKGGGPVMRTMQFDADKAVMLDEAGMIVTEKEGKLNVEFIAPGDRRPKDTAELDIVAGDEIGMAAGKRVSSAKLLREAYDSVKPGEEFKLGLRRDGKSFIVSFVKKDPKDLPKKMMIRTTGDEDPNRDVLPALGIVIEVKKDRVVVVEMFPNAPEGMAKGDVIQSLNGNKISTLHDFSKVFDNVEIGGELKFALIREGKTVTVVTTRTKPQGRMIVD